MTDSARWCATCAAWGDHHTDRHAEHRPKPRCSCPQKAHNLHRYGCKWAKEGVGAPYTVSEVEQMRRGLSFDAGKESQ